jgi:hypothetical protein
VRTGLERIQLVQIVTKFYASREEGSRSTRGTHTWNSKIDYTCVSMALRSVLFVRGAEACQSNPSITRVPNLWKTVYLGILNSNFRSIHGLGLNIRHSETNP